MKQRYAILFSFLIFGSMAACGSGGGASSPTAPASPITTPVGEPPAASPPITVGITPDKIDLPIGATHTFQADVAGDPHPAVLWKVQEPQGGTITPDGTYTAPEVVGTYHVVAADESDPAVFAVSEVIIQPPSVSIDPAQLTLHAGESRRFVSQVSGSTDLKVNWTIQEGASGGSIQTDGTYTASDTPGVYHVVATSEADPNQTASATVNVIPWIVIPRFAYAVNSASNDLSIYTVDATTGALAKAGSIATGDQPYAVSADPSGQFVYAGNFGSNNVSMYRVDPATGLVTPTGVVDTGVGPYSIAIDPAGKYAYVANENSSPEVWIYQIDPQTGKLSVSGKIEAGTSSISIAADPLGRFVYVANNSSNTISVYTVNAATGALTHVEDASGGTNPNSVAIDPSGRFAYVANYGSGDVWWYQINPKTGQLTKKGTIAAGNHSFSIAIDPSGRFAYVANSATDDVSMYRIDAGTGALKSLGAIGGGMAPRSITVDPSGHFVYVANLNSDTVSEYKINLDSGALTAMKPDQIAAGTQTRAIKVTGARQ